ncbi:MAG: hypothetical protein II485_05210, partial [Firmicutes bacterium]|nr:hypothetical protein [Bacillota bacterium]
FATLSLSGPEFDLPGMSFVPLREPFMDISVIMAVKKKRTFTKALSRILSFAMDYTKDHDL